MNIDDLTIGEAKTLMQTFGGGGVGKKCIIRCYASGVHFGEVLMRNGREVELINARRLWRWNVSEHGISLSEVSQHGVDHDRSKICETVPSITILDALEIIPCSAAAVASIVAAPVHKL